MDKHYEESCANSRMPHIHNGVNKLNKEALDNRFRVLEYSISILQNGYLK